MGLARQGNQKRAAVPVLPSARLPAAPGNSSASAVGRRQGSPRRSRRDPVATVRRDGARRGDKKCEQRCERMVLRPDALEIRKKSRLVSADRKARERLALVGGWPSIGRRDRALVVNEHEPRANFNFDDVLKAAIVKVCASSQRLAMPGASALPSTRRRAAGKGPRSGPGKTSPSTPMSNLPKASQLDVGRRSGKEPAIEAGVNANFLAL